VAWKLVPNAGGYQIDLELNGTGGWSPSPTTSVTVSDPKATSYQFAALPADGGYRWRVVALTAPGDVTHMNSLPSGRWYFDYASTVKLSIPAPVSPINGAKFYNNPRLTTLACRPVPGATGYTVELEYKDPATGKWVADTIDLPPGPVTGEQNSSETFTAAIITPATKTTPAEPVTYRWRVTALGDGTTTADSGPSPWYQFNYHN
jgi:hypothetical protein